jgi:putative nucleotidyltransferase with HDIG domain
MTANIMKMVNSAFFGARQPIATTDRAVAYLGLDTLGALVLGHSVFKGGSKASTPGFSMERLWAHSLQTAMAARVIALSEKFPPAEAEKAFLAGFLHDVGKIVFATGTAAMNEDSVAQMDAQHAQIGAYLLGLWGFPNPIVEAVAFHHAPGTAALPLSLVGVVHIADHLVHQKATPAPLPGEHALQPGFLEALKLVERLPAWHAALDKLDVERSEQ